MTEGPPTDGRRIVNVFVVWTLGLVVLFGSPALSVAAPPTPVATFCGCTCWYSGAGGKTLSKGVSFTTDRSCSIYNGQTCFCNDQTCYLKPDAGTRYKGAVTACKKTLPMKQAEPSANAPTGGVKPPAGQPPASR